MFSIIPLPADFMSSILSNVSTIMTDLSSYIALLVGVILIGVILDIIIGAIRRH